jgi:hypothetical protein
MSLLTESHFKIIHHQEYIFESPAKKFVTLSEATAKRACGKGLLINTDKYFLSFS